MTPTHEDLPPGLSVSAKFVLSKLRTALDYEATRKEIESETGLARRTVLDGLADLRESNVVEREDPPFGKPRYCVVGEYREPRED